MSMTSIINKMTIKISDIFAYILLSEFWNWFWLNVLKDWKGFGNKDGLALLEDFFKLKKFPILFLLFELDGDPLDPEKKGLAPLPPCDEDLFEEIIGNIFLFSEVLLLLLELEEGFPLEDDFWAGDPEPDPLLFDIDEDLFDFEEDICADELDEEGLLLLFFEDFWIEDPELLLEDEPEPEPLLLEDEPEPVLLLLEDEIEPEPLLLEDEPEPEPLLLEDDPEPVLLLLEDEPEPEPLLLEDEPEPVLLLLEDEPEPLLLDNEPDALLWDDDFEAELLLDDELEPLFFEDEPKPLLLDDELELLLLADEPESEILLLNEEEDFLAEETEEPDEEDAVLFKVSLSPDLKEEFLPEDDIEAFEDEDKLDAFSFFIEEDFSPEVSPDFDFEHLVFSSFNIYPSKHSSHISNSGHFLQWYIE